jgi:hypothetical protein
VRDYILFDPEGEYLRPRPQGFRLVEDRYEPIVLDAEDRLRSKELGYLMKPEGLVLRFFDATTGALVPTRQERVDRERWRAGSFAAEVERLKAVPDRGGGAVGGGSAE